MTRNVAYYQKEPPLKIFLLSYYGPINTCSFFGYVLCPGNLSD